MAAVRAANWAPAVAPPHRANLGRPAGSLGEAETLKPPHQCISHLEHRQGVAGKTLTKTLQKRETIGSGHSFNGEFSGAARVSSFWGQVAVCDWPTAGMSHRHSNADVARRSQQPIRCLASKKTAKAASETKTMNGSASGKGLGSGGSGRRGFGVKTATKKPETKQDAAARLKVSERVYSKLYDDDGGRSYIISVRRKGDVAGDWLPVVAMIVLSKLEGAQAVTTALPHVCREVAECARRYAIAFENCLSHELEYAFQSEKVFMSKPRVVEYLDRRAAADARRAAEEKTKPEDEECPYGVLGLSKGTAAAEVRTAYRAMAAAHHPDRHAEEEREQAEERFKRVARAYERIKQDMGGEGELVGGTGTLSEDELTVVAVEGYEDGPPPGGMKVGVYAMDSGITDLFVKDKKFKKAVEKSQQYWAPLAY